MTKIKKHYEIFYAIGMFLCLAFLFIANSEKMNNFIKQKDANFLSPLQREKNSYEVFGFAPYWTMNNLENVNFDVLTTLAYFGVPIKEDGNLDTEDIGYERYHSELATQIFKKAHDHQSRVVLTITLMENDKIEMLMDDEEAQKRTIEQTVKLVQDRGIDGINVDIEYDGNPGSQKRLAFTKFVRNIKSAMYKANPHSKVTVSVYASAAKYPKLYDIKDLAQVSDGIFMMAYDFATTGADQAMPTAPLKGYKEGEYWYDIETAVQDFLAYMPSDKLILGVPYYGYNYSVEKPAIKATTMSAYYWDANAVTQTYSVIKEEISEDMEGVSEYKSGWDQHGNVSWKAYYREETGLWRMVFQEDEKSLGIKYDFAKEMNLAGVGMWALGFDDGRTELWDLLVEKFGDNVVKFAKK